MRERDSSDRRIVWFSRNVFLEEGNDWVKRYCTLQKKVRIGSQSSEM